MPRFTEGSLPPNNELGRCFKSKMDRITEKERTVKLPMPDPPVPTETGAVDFGKLAALCRYRVKSDLAHSMWRAYSAPAPPPDSSQHCWTKVAASRR